MDAIIVPTIATAITALLPSTGAVVFGTTTVAMLAAYVIVTAATFGVSLALAKMAAKPKVSPQQQTIKQAIPPRKITFGRDKVAGAYGFRGADAQNINHRVLVFGQGPWDGIEAIYIADKKGGADMSAGTAIQPHQNNVTVDMVLGDPDQLASPIMTAAFPTLWTADHRGRGLVYGVLRARPVKKAHFTTYYPGGISEVMIEGRGLRLYDPRSGLTAWSENPALAVRWYLTSQFGLGIGAEWIDDSTFAAIGDRCDAPRARSGGGTEKMFTISHTVEVNRDPRQTLAELLTAFDGEIYPTPEGKVGLRGAGWEEPTIEITADDLVSPYYEISTESGLNARFQKLKVNVKDPANDYQPVELTPWIDPDAAVSEVGEFNALMVSQWRQCRHLAKIHMRKSNPKWRLTIHVRYAAALKLWTEEKGNCLLTVPELGFDRTPFRITAASLDLGKDTGAFTLAFYDGSGNAWSIAEEGTPPTVAPETTMAAIPPMPTGLVLTLLRTEPQAGIYQTRARATVNPAPNAWETIGRYRPVGATEWTDMSEDGEDAVVTGVLDDGVTYEVQAAHAGITGIDSPNIGAWTAIATISATADPTAPAAPAGATLAKAGSNVTVAWTGANSANYAGARIYRGTVNDSSLAGLVATVYGAPSSAGSWQDTGLANGTYWYWLRSINASGVAGSFTAPTPASITIP